MKIIELTRKPGSVTLPRLNDRLVDMETLIRELNKREIPDEVASVVNSHIERINTFPGTEKELYRGLKGSLLEIYKLLEKELKIVPRNLYRNRWMAIGMSVFGIPLGVAFGVTLDNMGFIGIGLPIGLAIGIALGAGMDKKAAEEGRQLDLDFNLAV